MSASWTHLDGIEIKVTVKPDQIRLAEALLQLDPREAELREIYFYEDVEEFCTTGKLKLLDQHIILRARKKKNAPDDSTVKFRPVESTQRFLKWKSYEDFKLEGDWVGTRQVVAASLTAEQQRGEIIAVAEGRRAVHKLFSEAQERFLQDESASPIQFERLEALGPIEAYKWQVDPPPGLESAIAAEYWKLPDQTAFLELSIRAKPAVALRAQVDFTHYLQEHRLDPKGVQETKTQTVLKYFAEHQCQKRGDCATTSTD